jgi:hypothetical protein
MDGVSSLEYDSVRQERDMLREELQKSRMAAENLRMDLQVGNTQQKWFFCLFVFFFVGFFFSYRASPM